MSGTYDHLGFTLVQVNWGNSHRTAAQIRCVECGKTLDAPVATGIPLDPEGRSKWANGKGWKTKPFRKTGTYCPTCAGPARLKNDTESELKKVVPMPVASAPIVVREATADQRMKIRSHLDKSFDDAVGMYLDEMSDQRIAELVGVPRIIVERMRDTAYGPIKIDPAAQVLRSDLAALKAAVDGQQKALDSLKAKVLEASSRLETVLTKAAA